MSDDQIERVVVVWDALGVGDPAVDVQPQRLPVAGGDLDHARREIGDRSAPCHPRLDQVQQEKPAAATQLEGVFVRQSVDLVIGDDGVEAVPRVVDAALVVGDRPLLVVVLRFPVVVEHLGQLAVVTRGLDLLGGGVRLRRRIGTGHGRPA